MVMYKMRVSETCSSVDTGMPTRKTLGDSLFPHRYDIISHVPTVRTIAFFSAKPHLVEQKREMQFSSFDQMVIIQINSEGPLTESNMLVCLGPSYIYHQPIAVEFGVRA